MDPDSDPDPNTGFLLMRLPLRHAFLTMLHRTRDSHVPTTLGPITAPTTCGFFCVRLRKLPHVEWPPFTDCFPICCVAPLSCLNSWYFIFQQNILCVKIFLASFVQHLLPVRLVVSSLSRCPPHVVFSLCCFPTFFQ